ncbi:MAG: FkbM family methyltransferase [Sphingobacteriaceae bacterium]
MKAKLPLWSLLQPAKLKALLSFGIKGYLADIGWIRSFDSRSPVDAHGEALPWVTYSFIDFIKSRISNQHLIFEFGSGNSTIFYAKKAKQVVSVEHDKAWFDKIKSASPANAEMIFSELETNGAYSQMPLSTGNKYHIIIVDGRDRVNCSINALPALTDDGVLVLDDSEREFYQPAIDFMKKSGFKELAFSGISPGLFYYKTTSVFYRNQNCLGI